MTRSISLPGLNCSRELLGDKQFRGSSLNTILKSKIGVADQVKSLYKMQAGQLYFRLLIKSN